MEKVLLIDASCILGKYDNIREASNDTMIEAEDIKNALQNGAKTSSGYFVKIAAARKAKPVVQLKLDGETIVCTYASVYEAKKKTGIMNITNCAKGKAKSAGGYKWQYIDNSIEDGI